MRNFNSYCTYFQRLIVTTFTTEDRINSDEETIFQKMMRLVIKNDYLERELKHARDLLSKGVLDSHSYILGFNDGKQSRKAEIEALKASTTLNYNKGHEDGRKLAVIEVLKSPPAEITDEEIIEELAQLEHHQWMMWANNIVATESISEKRKERWATCMIPYAELSEEMKEHDRVWARQALVILRKASEK